ncbi:type I-E CRISPR-associated protein Cas6/Cse3/CasE [Streptomyces sp. NBC_01754]|uniref:type I-E CRISPR-associated protein Cas6/Cse3/CasE n=1 Tax=Streptomyces sp. NBC_01754 TaxID=2975930 RepID=UPI002DDB7679|nr:type I-E CRISPR-associated protein Cas6/Cse3/CasE [Streptomyces sp. NBC_01754]WSC93452.1 type I-E CRISPR-associated protein Cas6/Cse3/CasE [Streptomyces sp. NBC_01754]
MYLTRFRFNAARTGARRLLTSPQMLHAAVMSSFPEPPGTPQGGPRVLWRVDHNAAAEILLYLTSPDRPDLTHLVEQAGWPAAAPQGWATYDYSTFLAGLSTDSVWTFRLTANPVHSIRRKEGEPTKRTAHRTAGHQLQWLLKQQESGGFAIAEKAAERRLLERGDAYQVMVGGARSLAFTKSADGPRKPVTIATVSYQGRLRVTDADVFRRKLVSGLGKAKAYGCGLMTLAPVA